MATFTYAYTGNVSPPQITDLQTSTIGVFVTGVGNALVTGVSLTIEGLTHSFASDLDLYLRSPQGRDLLFMSDVRGGDNLSNARLTFQDGASAVLEDFGTGADVASGTYRPFARDNTETANPFGPGSIPLQHATADDTVDFASVFGGRPAAGFWFLSVADDASGDTGSLQSWSLSLSVDSSRSVYFATDQEDIFVVVSDSATSGEFFLPSSPGLSSQTVVFSGVSGFDIDGRGGNDLIQAGAGNDSVQGGTGDDLIQAGAGNDFIRGGAGRDRLYGEAGNDTFAIQMNGLDGDLEKFEIYDGGSGTDTLTFTGIDGGNEDLRLVTLRSIEAISLPGISFVSTSEFQLNADQFGAGLSLTAAITAPNDSSTYRMVVDMIVGTTLDLSGLRITGLDEVKINGTGVSERIIGTSVRDQIYGNGGNDSLYGRVGNDYLEGGVGNDILDGGLGADGMNGGDGNDLYYVDNAGDLVFENQANPATGGIDTVYSYLANYTLGANVENGRILATGAANLTGNTLNNTLTGNSSANFLNGSTGADTMVGGDGSDLYVVDNAGDVVSETNANPVTGGTDTVYSYLANYTLGANVENGRIVLGGPANLTGNTLNNTLFAGAGNNVLNGSTGTDTASYAFASSGVKVSLSTTAQQNTIGSGLDTLVSIENLTGSNFNDTLTGNTGANVLNGLGGNDVLNGSTGADTMIGGDGSDLYVVDNAGDVVSETNANPATGGTDTVYSYLANYTLGTNVENGRIVLGGPANLTGNTLNNTLFAGAGNNVLNGSTGTDTASYAFASSGVKVSLSTTAQQNTIGSGLETLVSIENITGSNFNDTLIANAGANVLNGLAGNDTLNGAGGFDKFVFNTALSATTNVDTIVGFSIVDDLIYLENEIFTRLTTGSLAVSSSTFRVGASALDADDYLIYNKTNGNLIYDSNGNAAGGATLFADLDSNLALTAGDFFVT
jgi:Ca2+-binding RTX toxin-like protein